MEVDCWGRIPSVLSAEGTVNEQGCYIRAFNKPEKWTLFLNSKLIFVELGRLISWGACRRQIRSTTTKKQPRAQLRYLFSFLYLKHHDDPYRIPSGGA